VLSARYGVEGRRLKEGGRGGSVWWREFVHIRDGVGLEVGGWLEDNLPNEIDNGDNTFFFWTERCFGTCHYVIGFVGFLTCLNLNG